MSELDQLKADYADLGKRIEKLEAKEAKDWPQKGNEYWFIASDGIVYDARWDNYPVDKARFNFGNVFRTKEEVELHRLRLQSMAKRWRPEDGECWIWQFHLNQASSYTWEIDIWEADSFDLALYWIGNCHPSKAAAEAWGREYAKAFEVGK